MVDLGRFAGPPPLVVAKEVLSEPMDFGHRRDIWRSTGLVPALATVAELFARLDLAIINNQRSTVEKSFVSGISGGLRKTFR